MLGLEPRDRRCKSCRADQPSLSELRLGEPISRSVAQSSERAAWAREAAGGNPAAPTIFERVVGLMDEWMVGSQMLAAQQSSNPFIHKSALFRCCRGRT